MLKRTFLGVMLILLLISVLTSPFSVQFSKAEGEMYIKPEAISGDWLATTDWNKTYGGTGYEEAYSVVQTSDEGYALTGYTTTGVGGGSDFWLVKTNSAGNIQWNKTHGGGIWSWDRAYSVVQTSDGGYALAGYTGTYEGGPPDFWLVKTDVNGSKLWDKKYGGMYTDRARSVVQTSDGGYAIAGYTDSYGAGSVDFLLVKTDSAGNLQWNKTYGGIGKDNASSLIQTNDGGYAIAGYTASYGAGMADSWLVKTDSAGTAQWNKTYGGTGYEEAYSVVQTSDGGYALAGYTNSSGAGNWDFWLIKTDSAGSTLWNRTYGGVSGDFAHSLVKTSDGGYAIVGYTDSYGAGGSDFWFVKTDSVGNALWNKTYGGTSRDDAFSLVQTNDGGYAMAGLTSSFGAGNYDFWLVKLTPVTIYIHADGSVDPTTAPIQRNGNIYTLTNNIYSSAGIVIQRNNIIVNGNGYTLQGAGSNYDGFVFDVNNVTIQNTEIRNFGRGINGGSGTIANNVISNCNTGIRSGSNQRVLSNIISQCGNMGIGAVFVHNLTIQSNIITDTSDGIEFAGIESTIIGNTISNNSHGLLLAAWVSGPWGYSNVIKLNNILNNQEGITILNSEPQAFQNNSIYHNNMINNSKQVAFNSALGVNIWDNGYPSGGNYWSNYNGTDLFRGVYQNMTGNDGIGDTPYFINASNTDRYPLMNPFAYTTPGSNVTVYPAADVGLTFANVTRLGSASTYKTDILPEWMPSLPRLVGRYVDVTVTAGSYGKITVAVSYDDSNMTEEEENSLQLLQWKGCDVTGPTPGVLDGIVNMRDIGFFCSKFMVPGGSEEWEPRCDVTGSTPGVPDGVVNMRDIGEVCSNFMGTNQWTDITTYIDTENNIIYGETTHFSMFGVTRD